jgi:DNA-3-methyladenine glycosylase I
LTEPAPCFGAGDPAYLAYHDHEWGRPVRDEQGIYERLCLEGFQSGLSWLTILRKRPAFREAFAGFDPDTVSAFRAADVERLVTNPAIVRHRGKIEAAIANARATRALRAEGTPLQELVWSVRSDAAGPVPESFAQVPSSTEASIALARRLGRAGFRFVGPTTVYSTMQACGVVNDHLACCPVRAEVERERAVRVG